MAEKDLKRQYGGEESSPLKRQYGGEELSPLKRQYGGEVPNELKKGSYTVPKMCGGGKVIKSWSK